MFQEKKVKNKQNEPKDIMWLFVGENRWVCVKVFAFLRMDNRVCVNCDR